MSDKDREKWDRRYAEGSYQARSYPSPFLETWLGRLPARTPAGRALDLGCGAGRNALRLAEAGYRVDAIDISQTALARARKTAAQRGLDVSWRQADLDGVDLERGAYALVTVIRYMNRRLHAQIPAALAAGGWLLFEHHFRAQGPVGGPSDDAFRLEPQELLQTFCALRVVCYEERPVDDPDGRRMALARLVAVNGDPGF